MRRFQVGLGRGFTPANLPFPDSGSRGTPATLGKASRADPCPTQPSPVPQGLMPAGGGVAPSQLMLAAKGGFIRAPLKEMLIVTFLHD